jgi:CRP-like cAMP-binding protein
MKAVFKTTGTKDPVKDSSASYPAGEVIFRQGELGTDMFIIQDGEVQIIKHIADDAHRGRCGHHRRQGAGHQWRALR